MRTRSVYSHVDGHKVAEYVNGECVFMDFDYYGVVNEAPMVVGDLPAYTSPIDGRLIDGRAQRREDLKRNGCRPYEGRVQEAKEAMRQIQYQEQAREAALDRVAHQVYHQFPYSKRDLLKKASRG